MKNRTTAAFIVLLFVVSLMGCDNENGAIREARDFLGKQVMFPAILFESGNHRYSLDAGFKAKIILYYDSLGCTTCKMKGLYHYNDILSKADSVSDFCVRFIIQAQATDYEESDDDYPIIWDPAAHFERANPTLPKTARCRIFLLDRNDRVVLVGDPLSSDGLWDLYLATLDNLLAHDGLYVAP